MTALLFLLRTIDFALWLALLPFRLLFYLVRAIARACSRSWAQRSPRGETPQNERADPARR